ncbi:MAG: putative porin [Chthoniobacterales bacterium]
MKLRSYLSQTSVALLIAASVLHAQTPEEITDAAADVPIEPVAGERTVTVNVSEEPLPMGDVDYDLTAAPDLLTPPDFSPAPEPDVRDLPTPSHSVTINLINRLVEKGILTREDAAELIAQAEADAQIARARDEMAVQAIAETNAAAETLLANTPPPPTDDALRVTYVPSFVKNHIRDEIKEDLLVATKTELLHDKTFLPDWVRSVEPFADVRFRYESIQFPSGNDDSGVFPNFDAINTGSPFDVTGDEFSPQINVSENRDRLRIRLRLGAEIALEDGFTMGFRLATGNSNSPVSANQTLGTPDGNFNKYQIWVDRAFIGYELRQGVDRSLGAVVGRFSNPFFRPSQIMWDNDIGFDGVAVSGRYDVGFGLTPFFSGGVFPIFNTALNFPSNSPNKLESYDKYLYAIQGGLDWDITKHVNVTTALGYYNFQNIEGQLSDPYVPLDSNDAGSTDNSRPLFAQKGNTYRPIRNIIPTEANNFGTINQFQYYGLATKFENIAFSGQINLTYFEPVNVAFSGEYVKNVAFDRDAINDVAVNNRGDVDPDDLSDIGDFVGSDTAWIVQVEVGTVGLEKRWDWNVAFGYRYVGSDAVVDGFNDSNFGGGGTNLKGFTVGGSVALSKNVWITASYLSGRSIAGPQLREDRFQLDLNAKF